MSGVRRNMSRDTSRDVSRGVTPRAVLFGLVLVGVISVMSPWAILVVKGSQLTSNAIPIIAIFLLFLVTVVLQPILRWLGKHGLFTRPELITIYVMMLVGSVVVTTGFTGTFLSVITGATGRNKLVRIPGDGPTLISMLEALVDNAD